MCGRYAITSTPQALREFLGYIDAPNFPPRFNVAPTQPIPIICLERAPDGPRRRFMLARWGFLPGFVKDVKSFPLLINARAEGVEDKPSFRAAMRRRRCIVPADAYYEWLRLKDGPSRPFLFRRKDGKPMGLAGLFETWCGADGSELDTACILTTDASAATVAIHDRMPAVLRDQDFAAWLDCDEVSAAEAARLIRPAPPDALEFFEISRAVNKVANDGPEIQQPVAKLTATCPDSELPWDQGSP